MTAYQNRVLKAMPDKWASIVEITDAIYPRRMNEKVHGLRRSCVRNAVSWLERNGYLISDKRGMFRPYDPSGYTSQYCGETVEVVTACPAPSRQD